MMLKPVFELSGRIQIFFLLVAVQLSNRKVKALNVKAVTSDNQQRWVAYGRKANKLRRRSKMWTAEAMRIGAEHNIYVEVR